MRRASVLFGVALMLSGCGSGSDTASSSLSPPGAPASAPNAATVSAKAEGEPEASADASSTISLNAGWNPVGLECEEVTGLTPGPGVVGMALWDGRQYQVGNLDLEDLNEGEGGRRGLYIYCTRSTSLTYRGRGGGAGLGLREGWNLVSFTTRTEVSCGNITGEIGEMLPTLYECGPDNRVSGVHIRTGSIRPGRPYWVYCRRPIRIKCPNGTPPAPSPTPRPSPKPSPLPSVKPSPAASPSPAAVASPSPAAVASPSPQASPSPIAAASPSPIPAASPSPAAEPSPSPKGNNGGGNGTDPQPPGDPPIND